MSSLRRQSDVLVTRGMRLLGGLAASIFAITIPFLYFGLSVYGLQESHRMETAHLAKSIEKIIQARPDLWEFEHMRLLEVVSQPSIDGDLDERTIRTAAGTVVVKTDFSATSPAITVSAAFFDSGILAGSIEARHSIRKQLFVAALLGMLSSSFGYLFFFIFRTYPVRRLENALADLQRAQEEVLEMSLRDQMTELYNRRGFITLAEQQIRAANRAQRAMLLTFIDLDGLKWINDTLGHEEGDRVLIDTANVLRQTFRESDIIARLGGDEFAVLSIDAADVNPEDFSKRLQENIDAGIAKETRPYKMAMSWGTAVYDPGSPLSLDELMSSADERMYAQKKVKANRRI